MSKVKYSKKKGRKQFMKYLLMEEQKKYWNLQK